MQSNSSRSGLSRRAFVGVGAALASGALLPGCSGRTLGAGAPRDANAKLSSLPKQVPLEQIEGASISSIPGVAPAYTTWPAHAPTSVRKPPGHGETVRSLAPTWSTAPPPASRNTWIRELDRRLEIRLSPNIAADYASLIGPVVASGNLPELTYVEWTANPTVLQAIQQGALTDLTPFLSGDNIEKYPNLARFPSYAWEASALMGKLWIVPNTLSRINQFDVWRADWAAKLGHTAPPKDAADVFDLLTAFARRKPVATPAWALGTLNRGFVLASEMYAVPTTWRLDGTRLENAIETDEYVEALNYTVRLRKAGVFHPDAKEMPDTKERQLYAEGKLMFALPSLDLYFGNGTGGMRGDLAKVDPAARSEFFPVPGAKAGAKPNPAGGSPGFWGGGAIPASIGKDRKRVEELLAIMDFWAAPFGTAEFLFMHYGIEGRHFRFDAKGQPKPVNDPAVLSELNANVMCAPVYQYYPAAPETATLAQHIISRNVQLWQPNPTQGLISATAQRGGAELDNLILDARNQVLSGRTPVKAFADSVKEWRRKGGDQIREEYQKAMAERDHGRLGK